MTIDEAAQVLWDYHQVGHGPVAADLIFVPGSNDSRVAERAAELFHAGLAPRILFSGGTGRLTAGWQVGEAERFAAVARDSGVPDGAILVETRATNTGENIRFSRELLESVGMVVTTLLAVQKPYMERRTLAALEAQWPGVGVRVTSPRISFDDYPTTGIPRDLVIDAMVGDFQRILDYPARGFATVQPVSDEAREAFAVLVAAGHVSQLV